MIPIFFYTPTFSVRLQLSATRRFKGQGQPSLQVPGG